MEWIRGTTQLDKSQTRLILAFKIPVIDVVVLVEEHPDSVFPVGG